MTSFPDCQRIDADTTTPMSGLLFYDAFRTQEEYIHAGHDTGRRDPKNPFASPKITKDN
ncbi:hypothetical protein [Desulfofustis limnaeus]|uniref:Uncharacterized protein n=1 Tax=Desulfofustis limnaeus TaxID=2740163 RepID=A0ABM7W536_9BACT|nr:hypothetical protein [Desulfofustis limnaeus]BDD86024.1 hypothetical protein DPPLL_03890 [Desulfofustis limnaeus]